MLVLVGKQGSAFCQFHNHVHLAVLNERVPQFADMWVINSRVQVDFPLEQQSLVVCDFLADVNLDGE